MRASRSRRAVRRRLIVACEGNREQVRLVERDCFERRRAGRVARRYLSDTKRALA